MDPLCDHLQLAGLTEAEAALERYRDLLQQTDVAAWTRQVDGCAHVAASLADLVSASDDELAEQLKSAQQVRCGWDGSVKACDAQPAHQGRCRHAR